MIDVRLAASRGAFTLAASFTAPPGITALFGPSGAGKSTVLSMIAGLAKPDAGHVRIGGRTLLDTAANVDRPAHKRRVGVVFQDGRLFPHLTVAGNLAFGRRFAPRQHRGDPQELIDLLQLGPLLARKPATLSGGERQRVAFARAVLAQPAALLCDEPLAALDAGMKADILPYIAALGQRVPMIYVTHAFGELLRLADHAVLIADGATSVSGPVVDVFANAQSVAALGPRDVGAVLEGTVARHGDGLTVLTLGDTALTVPRLDAAPGAQVRVRINASDVILAREASPAMSTNNILPGHIVRIDKGAGPGALVSVTVGAQTVLARVTQKSAAQLALAPGLPCSVVLKALAVPQDDITVRA